MKENSNTENKENSKTLDEDAKAKHDLMTKILGWGMIVYFLILGYSLNQSSLFELRPNKQQANVANAKRQQANVLREQNAAQSSNSNARAAEIVKAAELDLEAKKLDDEVYDGQSRAVGLIMAATVFLVAYLVLVYKFYQKFESQMKSYIVSRNIALLYAAFIGGSIWITATMTAFF